MNVSRSRIDVKMHRIKIKTFKKSSELSESLKSFEQTSFKSSKIDLNLSITAIDQMLNEINNLNSKYFESSQTVISTSANRILNINSTNATSKAFEIFDDSMEKIDFIPKKIDFAKEKSTQFLFNIVLKNAKETTRKRKVNKSSLWCRKISNSTKIVTNMNDAINNETKYLMYALNLIDFYHKSQI